MSIGLFILVVVVVTAAHLLTGRSIARMVNIYFANLGVQDSENSADFDTEKIKNRTEGYAKEIVQNMMCEESSDYAAIKASLIAHSLSILHTIFAIGYLFIETYILLTVIRSDPQWLALIIIATCAILSLANGFSLFLKGPEIFFKSYLISKTYGKVVSHLSASVEDDS